MSLLFENKIVIAWVNMMPGDLGKWRPILHGSLTISCDWCCSIFPELMMSWQTWLGYHRAMICHCNAYLMDVEFLLGLMINSRGFSSNPGDPTNSYPLCIVGWWWWVWMRRSPRWCLVIVPHSCSIVVLLASIITTLIRNEWDACHSSHTARYDD